VRAGYSLYYTLSVISRVGRQSRYRGRRGKWWSKARRGSAESRGKSNGDWPDPWPCGRLPEVYRSDRFRGLR